MAGFVTGVISAVIAGATLGHTIESSNQQRRIAGQKKNEANAIAQTQEAELKKQEQAEALKQEQQQQILNKRRRSLGPMGGGISLGSLGPPQGAPIIPGQGTTIGG